MPALLGLDTVYKPPKLKLPTVSSIAGSLSTSPATSGGYLPIPKQSRDPYNLIGVAPQAGPFPEGFSAGGSAGANVPGAPPPYTPPIYTEAGDPATPDWANFNQPLSAPPPQAFDFAGSINSDPLYMQLQKDVAAQIAGYGSTRKQQTDSALQQFGEIPDLTSAINGLGLDPNSPMYQMLFSDIDEPTRNAAKALTDSGLSTVANLDRTHQTDIGNLLDQLAARGTVQSGATGVGLGQADRTYSGNQYNARTSLLNYLTGVQSAFNQAVQQSNQRLSQGAQDAAQRQIALQPQIGTVTG